MPSAMELVREVRGGILLCDMTGRWSEASAWRADKSKWLAKLDAALTEMERDQAFIAQSVESMIEELAALVPNPKEPDWMPALGASNPADAACLQKVWGILHSMPSEFAA